MVKKQSKVKKVASAEEQISNAQEEDVTNTGDNELNEEPSQVKENGQETVTAKKKAAPKKTKTSKPAKPAVEPERKSCRAPKPVKREGDAEQDYEVEKIVDMRKNHGTIEYQVRWKGYSRGDDTWEEESALASCKDLLQEFKLLQKSSENKKSSPKKRAASKSPVKAPAKKKKTKTTKKVEKDYEVEEIVGMRLKNGKKEFKIRWKGFKASDDTWEPEKNLSCQDMIKNYLESHPEATEEEDEKEKDSKEEDEESTEAKTVSKKTSRTKAAAKGKSKRAKKTK